MKVLVITALTQGRRPNDFCHATEGELALLPFECDCDTGPDGPCGCRRSFAGETSHRGSTTARIADLPLRRDEYQERVSEARRGEGWCAHMSQTQFEQWVAHEADELLGLAARLPVGAVVEKRGARLQVRPATTVRRAPPRQTPRAKPKRPTRGSVMR